MAGEVEETFSINFQADSIHSGSISFGRFEREPLSWERRSSFSHNRYLEEVEKCSKPGSVIQKKAYFEAHFKKKGLFGIMPSAGHDRSDRENSENDGSDEIGNQDDFEPNEDGDCVQIEKFQDELNEGDYYIQFDQRSQEDFELDEADHFVKMERRSQVEFELNAYGSDYHGECGVIRCGGEDAIRESPIVSFSCLQMERDMNKSNDLEDSISKSNTLDAVHHSENETSNMISANDEAITEVKKQDDDIANPEESSRNIRMTVNEPIQDMEKTILHDPANHYRKETKPEPGLNSEVNNIQVQKGTSARSSYNRAKNHGRDSPRRTNIENNLSKLATPTTRSMNRSAREVSVSVEKLFPQNKSERVSRAKKDAESQPSVLKTDSKGIHAAERLNQAFNIRKSGVRPSATSFDFKCSERAERRKEFYLKLEEKMHAKEEEMNQMQAISQEKKEADIKKLRKSLNFKATPMPPFYRSTLPSKSPANKAVSNNTRSKKVQNQPKCQGIGAETPLPSKSKMGNDQAAGESITSTEPCNISPQPYASPAPSTDRSSHPNSVTNNYTSGKKDRAKVTQQKHKVSESSKGVKGQSNQGSKNGETTRHINETMRKGVRNVGLRGSSRSGNLTVRVAS